MNIEDSEGYKKLLAAVEADEQKSPGFHDYRAKLSWVLARVKHYAEKTGIEAAALLDAWEKQRGYWYMNFYHDGNQPEIEAAGKVHVFETVADLQQSIGQSGFRCPACEGVSKNPYECDSGLKRMGGEKTCDWKSYGLFSTLGKGAYIFVKAELRGQNIFWPVAWPVPSQEVATPGGEVAGA